MSIGWIKAAQLDSHCFRAMFSLVFFLRYCSWLLNISVRLVAFCRLSSIDQLNWIQLWIGLILILIFTCGWLFYVSYYDLIVLNWIHWVEIRSSSVWLFYLIWIYFFETGFNYSFIFSLLWIAIDYFIADWLVETGWNWLEPNSFQVSSISPPALVNCQLFQVLVLR